jgi:hypothetical protein
VVILECGMPGFILLLNNVRLSVTLDAKTGLWNFGSFTGDRLMEGSTGSEDLRTNLRLPVDSIVYRRIETVAVRDLSIC